MSGDRPIAIPSTLQRRTPATGLTWALRGTCVLVVVWSVTTLLGSWQERPVRATVEAFFQALIDGQNDLARNLIAPEVRATLPDDGLTGYSAPLADAVLHIHSVKVQGTDATVAVSIKRAGYELAPTVTLQRQPDGDWRLTRISKVAIDTRWALAQFQAQEIKSESLVDELKAGFQTPADKPDR